MNRCPYCGAGSESACRPTCDGGYEPRDDHDATPAFGRLEAERYAWQLNDSYIGPGPYKAVHSVIEGAWYVGKFYDGREVERIYRRPA